MLYPGRDDPASFDHLQIYISLRNHPDYFQTVGGGISGHEKRKPEPIVFFLALGI